MWQLSAELRLLRSKRQRLQVEIQSLISELANARFKSAMIRSESAKDRFETRKHLFVCAKACFEAAKRGLPRGGKIGREQEVAFRRLELRLADGRFLAGIDTGTERPVSAGTGTEARWR